MLKWLTEADWGTRGSEELYAASADASAACLCAPSEEFCGAVRCASASVAFLTAAVTGNLLFNPDKAVNLLQQHNATEPGWQ